MLGHSFLALLIQAQPGKPGEMTPDQQFQIAMEAMRRGTPEGGVPGILALLVPFALFAMVFGIVWLVYRRKQEQMQAQAVLHKQLLEKFSSGKEFSEFLESTGGQQFLKTLWTPSRSGLDHVLRMMRTGIVLTAVGLGVLALSLTRDQRGLAVPGVLFLALGLGFLISAAVSHRLTKRSGKQPDAGTPPAA